MKIERILIVGAGTMGRGIAQWFGQVGVHVSLCDGVHEVALAAVEKINLSWDSLLEKGKFNSTEVAAFKSHLTTVSLETLLPNYDLAIEAIFEDLASKTDLLSLLDRTLSPQCILASNTSSISISSLAKNLSVQRKSRFIGLHFFNPATIMKLVEVIEGHWSNQELLQSIQSWFNSHKKIAVRSKDAPGFIVNRIARNFYGESLHVAGIECQDRFSEIDHILTKVAGFPMGPFALMDLIGIDINYQVTLGVWEDFYHADRFRPHPLQRTMVESGRLGKKTNQGFYHYE